MDKVKKIIEMTCEHYQITKTQIMAKTRKKEIVIPRHAAMKLIHEHTQLSLKSIGVEFGGKDHSTVIHALTNVENMVYTDHVFRDYFKILQDNVAPLIADLPDKEIGMWSGKSAPIQNEATPLFI